ncbi:hypothetical protein AZE42_13401, partial [Rhizopogon vesiculosus]
MTVTLKD